MCKNFVTRKKKLTADFFLSSNMTKKTLSGFIDPTDAVVLPDLYNPFQTDSLGSQAHTGIHID